MEFVEFGPIASVLPLLCARHAHVGARFTATLRAIHVRIPRRGKIKVVRYPQIRVAQLHRYSLGRPCLSFSLKRMWRFQYQEVYVTMSAVRQSMKQLYRVLYPKLRWIGGD